jgi:hypothetical protein
MPKARGSQPGERRGGRKKGVPNRVTAEAREAFQAVYEKRLADLNRWLVETGDGFELPMRLKDGTPVLDEAGKPRMVKVGKDPGKAADLLLQMAEHFIPKLSRIERTISDSTDEELLAEVRRRKAEAEQANGPVGS